MSTGMVCISIEDRTVDVGKAFEKALTDCGMSHKEAAVGMFGVPDVSRLSKAIAGVLSLDDWRVVRLPMEFQVAYARRKFAAMAAEWLEGFRPQPVKADLRDDSRARRTA